MDESNSTCNKRFAQYGIPQTVEARRDYRELLILTPRLNKFISGAILSDETIRQDAKDGNAFTKILDNLRIIPGIKVDAGTKDLPSYPGETITEGLDNLRIRLAEYVQLGARFAKWRAVIRIGEDCPSYYCMQANAEALARYAALCQEVNLVPIVEPEVLMEGEHSLESCFEVTEKMLHIVFNQLFLSKVIPEGMILKPNMILAGLKCSDQPGIDVIADASIKCLMRTVPAAVPGIAFLSGGQAYELASARLNAMNARYKGQLPWTLTFSYSRALQEPALQFWKGKTENTEYAQKILYHRAKCNSAARNGQYQPSMEMTYNGK
jgi:fructose-bisphosphate aldolase class I